MGNLFSFAKKLFIGGQGEKERTSRKTPAIDIESDQVSSDDIQTFVQQQSDYFSGVYTVYFTNGHLSKIEPYPKGGYYENRDIANRADFIISDDVRYGLTSGKSIYSIAIPAYTHSAEGGIGTTGFLEYVFRMRSGRYWTKGDYKLSIACFEKATQLMKYSTMGWPAKDFYRIVNELNDLGKLKSAHRWKEWMAVYLWSE